MVETVLVPFDGSALSKRALELALSDYPESEVLALYVRDSITSGTNVFDVLLPFGGGGAPPGSVSVAYWEEWQKRTREEADEVFEAARTIAADHDGSVSEETAFGDAGRRIVAVAEDEEVDRIVMGSHFREGAERFLVGSVTDHVVRQGPVPVLVAH